MQRNEHPALVCPDGNELRQVLTGFGFKQFELRHRAGAIFNELGGSFLLLPRGVTQCV
jgi:hypothetical protein